MTYQEASNLMKGQGEIGGGGGEEGEGWRGRRGLRSSPAHAHSARVYACKQEVTTVLKAMLF